MKVLQAWVDCLTLMQQSVLLAAIRGPDGIRKDHISKKILRWYRRCVVNCAFCSKKDGRNEPYVHLNATEHCGGSFTGPLNVLSNGHGSIDDVAKDYVRSLDEIPHHFQLHLMHAAEIIGYKHPERWIRAWWRRFYEVLAIDMHLTPETEKEMEYRLGDSELQWRNKEVVTAE